MKVLTFLSVLIFALGLSATTVSAHHEPSIKEWGWYGAVGVGVLKLDFPNCESFEIEGRLAGGNICTHPFIPDDFEFFTGLEDIFPPEGAARAIANRLFVEPNRNNSPLGKFSIGYNAPIDSDWTFQIEGEFGFGGESTSELQNYGVNLRYAFTKTKLVFPFIGVGVGVERVRLKFDAMALEHEDPAPPCSNPPCVIRVSDSFAKPGVVVLPVDPRDVMYGYVTRKSYEYKSNSIYVSGSIGVIINPRIASGFRTIVEYRHYDLPDDMWANTGSVTIQWPF